MEHLCNNCQYVYNRRDMLRTLGVGFGYLAFASIADAATRLAPPGAPAGASPLLPRQPHFDARAKRVIFLCMTGGPSHLDTFDYKPKLVADSGQSAGAMGRRGACLLGSPFKFAQHGQSGQWISELFPELGSHADDLCIINSMFTDVPAHAQATVALHTGNFQFVRPSMGAWTLYGLGTENENLPGFVTVNPPTGQGGAQNYGSAFLPAIYQGMPVNLRNVRGNGEPIPNITNPRWSPAAQREQLDLVEALNRERLRREKAHPGIEGVIESYELAFNMQAEVPGVMDISGAGADIRELYGLDDQETSGFGQQCLLARKLVESGVRFVEVNLGGWDHHRNLEASLRRNCNRIDRPIAGLLADLKKRGLLEDTLVIWGGEFGRTPYAQGDDGRDHNNKGFSLWMAGGGVKGGLTYGSTDDYGSEAVENKVHIHDWHATVLHLLGLNHESLTYNHAGRDFRLTDVHGHVVKDIVA